MMGSTCTNDLLWRVERVGWKVLLEVGEETELTFEVIKDCPSLILDEEKGKESREFKFHEIFHDHIIHVVKARV